MKPIRVQRKRVKGWRMPENTICVNRPLKFGNPYDWRIHGKDEAVKLHSEWIKGQDLSELKGKNLACFCKLDEPCHADTLLRMANE